MRASTFLVLCLCAIASSRDAPACAAARHGLLVAALGAAARGVGRISAASPAVLLNIKDGAFLGA